MGVQVNECTLVLSILGTNVVSCPMSTRTARLTMGTALQLGKTFLAFLRRQIVTFVLAFAFDLSLPLPLNRCHATIATASNCRASVSASSVLWVFARVTQQSVDIRLMDFAVFRLILLTIVVVKKCLPPRKRLCQSIP